jgi:hypothetical protein
MRMRRDAGEPDGASRAFWMTFYAMGLAVFAAA